MRLISSRRGKPSLLHCWPIESMRTGLDSDFQPQQFWQSQREKFSKVEKIAIILPYWLEFRFLTVDRDTKSSEFF